MRLSPLQLLEYFVADFHFTLNTRFDANKELELKVEELDAVPQCVPLKEPPNRWTVVLDLKYQPAAETNMPYIFSLKLVGLFEVADSFEEAKIERLVRTNGASMLYSIARELIREQTARGPDGPFILPTATFTQDDTPQQAQSPAPAPALVTKPTTAQPQSEVKPSVKKRLVRKQPAKPSTQ